MNSVLERLKLGLHGTHYRSGNLEIQAKLEMFLEMQCHIEHTPDAVP